MAEVGVAVRELEAKPDYADCPRCGADEGMGICVRDSQYFIWCCICYFEGPRVDGGPSRETDHLAIQAWNSLQRSENARQFYVRQLAEHSRVIEAKLATAQKISDRLTQLHRVPLCQDHKPLRHPGCRNCQIGARIEELAHVLSQSNAQLWSTNAERLKPEEVGAALSMAWGKYVELFGVEPHGTAKQLVAMWIFTHLDAMRAENKMPDRSTER